MKLALEMALGSWWPIASAPPSTQRTCYAAAALL